VEEVTGGRVLFGALVLSQSAVACWAAACGAFSNQSPRWVPIRPLLARERRSAENRTPGTTADGDVCFSIAAAALFFSFLDLQPPLTPPLLYAPLFKLATNPP
jgi:hypothetical protein